jgi:hypothetical protein
MIDWAAVGLNLSSINKLMTNESEAHFDKIRYYFAVKLSVGCVCYVRFEVLTAVFMKSNIFGDILATCFLLGLFFDPGDGGDMFLRNVG